ncbi:DUF4126 domain-containing protein [Nodosilinea sp. E11]|uniref:DUF4126 domain-containing protein n=1 Tax=Nodosilinea sp. E11 TaxID=3037479 RepID=UPI002934B90A|nr:DUF4126 domain-containing protein [Nodosilinea sp. E11]WOD41734.1 DUF4126 domain-containing protein [Nodosilinea sp. E11]
MDLLLHVAIGIGLSAAAGFRILVPFLIAGIAAQQGYLALSPGMAWMASTPAIIAFVVATVLEVLIYFVPIVDNVMDAVELPAAAIAGTVLTAAVTGGDINPFLQWSLALIAGGSVASGTQAFTGLARLASTAAAGPVGNIAVSTTELVSSTILSVLAIAVPILVVLVVGVLMYLLFRRRRRKWRSS